MMTFLKTLKENRGGLLRLKTGLFWYCNGEWDGIYDRICIILDAATCLEYPEVSAYTGGCGRYTSSRLLIAALLLVDGSPKWVWVEKEDIEILTDNQNNRLTEKE